MVMQVQRIGNELAVVLSPQAALELGLSDGDAVEVQKAGSRIRYASPDEILRAFDATLPENAAAYRELAK